MGMRAYKSEAVPKPALNLQWTFTGPVDFEIGAGQGLHALTYSQANPQRTLVAVEKTHTRFNLLRRRLEHHSHITNLFAFHADAAAFTTHFIPDAALDRIFLLYPNPYPKAKQANLRWHNRPFLAHLLSKLKERGELTLATNLRWYAEEASEKFTAQRHLELLDFSARTGDPRTHFEIKYQERGEICWNLVFRKPACLPPALPVQ